MSNPKIPTAIQDKNGKHTTVHKNATPPAPTGRVANIGIPRSTDGMSNLERTLRETTGINIVLRHRLINAYLSDNGAVEVPRLINDNERMIDLTLLPILRELAANEDADVIDGLPSEQTSKFTDQYAENVTALHDDFSRDLKNLEMLDRDRMLTGIDRQTENPLLQEFIKDTLDGKVESIADWRSGSINHNSDDLKELTETLDAIPSGRSTKIKYDVVAKASDALLEANASFKTTAGLYDYYVNMEKLASEAPAEEKQAWDIVLNRISYYVGH